MSILTSEKILDASIALFSEKGYGSVTTKEIAKKARVSEMTIFRHFESKRNLFEKAFEKFVFSPKFKTLFENSLEWELEKDLLKISHFYQETLMKNQKIILMQFKNGELTSNLDSPLLKFPTEIKRLLIEYLTKMKEMGEVSEDPEVAAINFLAGNFGFFMTFLVNKNLTSDDLKKYLASYVKTVSKGITA